MKKLLLSGLVGLAFLVFGITASNASEFKSGIIVAQMDKCGASKCGGEKKGKCGGDMKSAKKDSKTEEIDSKDIKTKKAKCGAGKCGEGKCGGEKKSKCGGSKCGANG